MGAAPVLRASGQDSLGSFEANRIVLNGSSVVSDRERSERSDQPISTEAVGTLIWLLDTNNLDRRRYSVLNRLRAFRNSAEFETLPDALRQKVREALDDA